ncbi:hypothetical protein HYC85_024063 [Camellia sinensis]|uniref:Protein kinase domain-containing protein n=1 Tax=Camellia sinensis TaxID=4442 RepID=A0A7J7G7E1_CAMSI|nr:hypothetical protein HYC85_024063 [Camellia sinensis]
MDQNERQTVDTPFLTVLKTWTSPFEHSVIIHVCVRLEFPEVSARAPRLRIPELDRLVSGFAPNTCILPLRGRVGLVDHPHPSPAVARCHRLIQAQEGHWSTIVEEDYKGWVVWCGEESMGSSSSCCGSEKVDEGMTIGAGGNSSSTWRIFTYKELQVATNGFSEDNKLGEGGFGSVYWGRTSDGLQIAVKKLKSMNSKAEMEFAVEVEVLGRVRHKNLLGLRGCCAGGAEQRLIVYDYMPNLSLLSHLHGQFAGQVHLDWKRRMNIIIGSAQGQTTIINILDTQS